MPWIDKLNAQLYEEYAQAFLEKAYERFDKSFRGVGIWRFYVTVKK